MQNWLLLIITSGFPDPVRRADALYVSPGRLAILNSSINASVLRLLFSQRFCEKRYIALKLCLQKGFKVSLRRQTLNNCWKRVFSKLLVGK